MSQQNPIPQQNPIQALLKTCENFAQCIQTHLSHFVGHKDDSGNASQNPRRPLFSLSSKPISPITSDDASNALHSEQEAPPYPISLQKEQPAMPVSKEELGRATWTLLHTLAAQFPDHPTRQQRRDVKELMSILSRIYPCKECADHFKEVLKANPVQAGSQAEFSQWLCHVHNVVNRSLGKVVFPCHRVDARWGKLECKERACDLEGTTTNFTI
ncbi:FAD-linked sulfhydryl oxidase ERV1 isoform X2 [Cinnamomum micranthum f. kanehirae]|uniref:Sulfhydryl oxidase n=1 Tax=Cinnamomum micranthum f. kanehirae TaxID=337451 RepID=A0A443NHH8_9MAGN|nr:FAD-linked sulfhydryl oxidase ERV1 isoform X2 [Cinnamomum micranthum f. kanehirae]